MTANLTSASDADVLAAVAAVTAASYTLTFTDSSIMTGMTSEEAEDAADYYAQNSELGFILSGPDGAVIRIHTVI